MWEEGGREAAAFLAATAAFLAGAALFLREHPSSPRWLPSRRMRRFLGDGGGFLGGRHYDLF